MEKSIILAFLVVGLVSGKLIPKQNTKDNVGKHINTIMEEGVSDDVIYDSSEWEEIPKGPIEEIIVIHTNMLETTDNYEQPQTHKEGR